MKYLNLRVSERVQETDDAVSLVLDTAQASREALRYRAGQFLTVRVGQEHRCYSLSSAPSVDPHWKITIKRVANGKASPWLVESVNAGDWLSVLPPQGNFVLRAGAPRVDCYGAGSGITPIMSIIKEYLATGDGDCRLFYANRDRRGIIFGRELSALAQRYGSRLQVRYWLDEEHGPLCPRQLSEWAGPADATPRYVCGPAGFMDTVRDALLGIGVSGSAIHIERFTVDADTTPSPPAGVASLARISIGGRVHEVPVGADETILQAALRQGLDLPYSCTHGICGTCMAYLRRGRVNMRDSLFLTAEELAAGAVLTCQAVTETPVCELEFASG